MKVKKKLSRVLSLLLIINMVLAGVIVTDTYYSLDSDKAYAAGGTSSVMGTDAYMTQNNNIVVGQTYSFGGYSWIAAEANGDTVVLQSKGVTAGAWPGFVANNNQYLYSDYNDRDISNLYDATKSLYANIKFAEAAGGKGLYLISSSKATGNYLQALREVTTNYSSFGESGGSAWTGTCYGNNSAYSVSSGGNINGNYQRYAYVVAPAFNLSKSKVTLNENKIEAYTESSGIKTISSSIQSVAEGQSVDLSSIVNGIAYAGGTNAGKSASYTVSCNRGIISGTTYTAPTDLAQNETETFTVTSTRNVEWKTTVQVMLVQKAASKIDVTKKKAFPDSFTSGDIIDFGEYLTVTAKDEAGNSDGEITNYTITADGFTLVDGLKYKTGTVTDKKTISFVVTANQTFGTTSYVGMTYGAEDTDTAGKLSVVVKPGTSGYTDRDGLEDEKGFHEYTDKETNIKWKYKYDDSGNIRFLYTDDDVAGIISKGKVLLVPSSINGTAVTGIGGGRKNDDTIPFIPVTGDKANNTWTSIYIPSSIKYINDEAFASNQAEASVIIPDTVSEIGVGAFKGSKITSLAINTDKTDVRLYESAFEGCTNLTDVAIRGSHAVLAYYAFKDDASIKSLDIPYGTKYAKGSEDDSYAFAGTTGLEVIKIDTATVPKNIFSGNKNLKKVIFGENVTTVDYDWSGTASTEGNKSTLADTVDRATYVLNADTIFNMSKTTGGSPFGYKGNLTVVGKNHDLNGWENKYNNKNDPVIAKVAYLASEYQSNADIEKYAKGTADNIVITAEDNPASNGGVTETIPTQQTGIEAYCASILLTTKQLDKDKVSVYKMFNATQGSKYDSDEFFVYRTADAQSLLKDNVGKQTQDDNGDWYATNSDEIKQKFIAADSVTAEESDLTSGTLDLTVVVLRCDANGNIYVNHNTANNVKAFTYSLAVPVKGYSAENDFLENYGSYESVINTVDSLKNTNKKLDDEITDLNQQITDKNAKISDLEAQIATKNGNIDDLNGQISTLKKEKAALESDKTSLQKQLTDAEKKLSDTIQSYAKLLDATKIDKSDYTYSVTKDGVVKYYVLVNGEEYEYDKTSGRKIYVNGEKVTVYTGTDKEGKEFNFYVADDGVHIVTIVKDDDGNDTIASDTVSSDTVAAMQHKIAAQLQNMKDQLAKLESALDEIGASLNIDGIDGKTDDEKVTAIKNAITVLNKKISDLEASVAAKDKQISDLQKQNGQQAATIEQANATIKKLKDQITSVNAKLSETQEALDTANRNLDTANGNLTDAQQQITTISGNLQKIENDLATAQEALAEKQTDLEAANALIESTNAALTKAQGELSTARSDLATVQSTLSSTQEELAATKTALEAANTSLSGAQQEISSLNAEVENLRNTIAGYQSMLNSIKNALSLTNEADNTEILASISDLKARLDTLSEKVASLAALLGIDTSGKTDCAVMDEIINKVTKLTNEYDTVTKNYNKIVKKIYGANETVDISNKSVDEVLAAIDSLSGDTSAIAKQLQEAITGKTISDSDVQEVTVLLNQVKTMKNDLDQKSNLLNEIMEALGITDSAQIIQTILDLKTQVVSLQKENAELKANGSTTGGGTGYTKDTEVNSSSASYTSGYNAGYSKAARDFASDSSNNSVMSAQVLALTNSNSTLTKENAELKSENKTLQRENKNLIEKNETMQKNNDSLSSKVKLLTTSKNTLSAKVNSLTSSNDKLKASEKTLKAQVSSLQRQVNSLKNSTQPSTATTNRYTGSTNRGSSNTASVQPSTVSNSGTVEDSKDSKKPERKTNASDTNKKYKKPDTIGSENMTLYAPLDNNMGTELDNNMGTERQLGDVLETRLPSTTTLASDQQAATTLNQIDDSKVVDITTNAKDINAATVEQKNNALKIVSWYMNNLEELGNLGSPEVKDAATDSSKSVTFDMLASVDVTPSDAQQNAIDNKQNVDLTISSPDIEEGALYLVIHESDLRDGIFDVTLTKAYGSEIDIKLPDLSPVTLTKITVSDAESISSSSTQQSTEELPQEVEESNKNNSGYRIIMYILIVVAIGGAVTLLVLAKRRKGGSSRK